MICLFIYYGTTNLQLIFNRFKGLRNLRLPNVITTIRGKPLVGGKALMASVAPWIGVELEYSDPIDENSN